MPATDTATAYVESLLQERLAGLQRKREEAVDRVEVAQQNVDTFKAEVKDIDAEIAKVKSNLAKGK